MIVRPEHIEKKVDPKRNKHLLSPSEYKRKTIWFAIRPHKEEREPEQEYVEIHPDEIKKRRTQQTKQFSYKEAQRKYADLIDIIVIHSEPIQPDTT